ASASPTSQEGDAVPAMRTIRYRPQARTGVAAGKPALPPLAVIASTAWASAPSPATSTPSTRWAALMWSG
ncbi:MAG: hypothetical protein WBO46_21930, partial [Caldilineaceae bacterium]